MSMRIIPTQKWRALLLFIYVAALVGVSKYVFGEWFVLVALLYHRLVYADVESDVLQAGE